MFDPLLSGAIIFSSLLTLLSIGLTLTYQTTKVPNFAHGAFAAVGAFVTLTAVSFWGGNPYQFLFIAPLVGGAIGLAQYLIVFRPLLRRKATIVGLMITTLAIEFILLALINIYADYLSREFKIRSRYFLLTAYDPEIAGEKALLFAAPTLAGVTVTVLYLALTKTKFGVAMRAAIEDPSLASVVGINVNMVYAISWFIAGGLGGLAGALLPMWLPGNPDMGSRIIVSVFASSIVGGLGSVYGAVLGGFLIGLAEILVTNQLARELGPWVHPYRPLIPLVAIAITLLIASEGILGVKWRRITKGIQSKIAGFIRHSAETFTVARDEDSWGIDSVKHFLKLLIVFGVLQTALFSAVPEYYKIVLSLAAAIVPVDSFADFPPLVGFVSILAGGLVSMLAISALTHVWTQVVGGKGAIKQTIKSIAYGSTPLLLLGWIPFLGIVLAIWSAMVSVVGIKQLHELSTARAVTSVVLGTLCFIVPVGFLILLA